MGLDAPVDGNSAMLTEGEGEGEGDVPLDGVKTAEDFKFYSTQTCSADFQQRSVEVVEFGSRPAKRARLLNDKSNPAKESQACNSFASRLARDSFIEKKVANVIQMLQTYQADEPMSDSDSGITNELRARIAGMKVVGCVEASEYDEKKGNMKASAAQDDVKTVFIDSEGVERNAASTMIQQDLGDTASTSSDEGVFVIKMRSPTSKQLLHGPKLGMDQEELHNCSVAATRIMIGVQDAYDSPGTMGHCHGGGHDVDDRFIKSLAVEDEERTELDAEKVESSVELANVIPGDAGKKLKICSDIEVQHMQLAAADFRDENLDVSKSNQEAEVSPIHRSYSKSTELDEAYEHHSNELFQNDAENVARAEMHTSLGAGVQNDVAKNLDHCVGLDRERQVVLTRVTDGDIIDVGKLEAVKEDRTLALGSVDSTSDDGHQVNRYQEGHCNGCEDVTGVERLKSDTATSEIKKTLQNTEFVGDLDDPTILFSPGGPFPIGNIGGKDGNHINTNDQIDQSKAQVLSPASAGLKDFGKVIQEAPVVGESDSGTGQDLGEDVSDVVKVYARKRKRSTPTEIVKAESAALKEHSGFSKSEDVSRSQLKDQEPLGERIIKHYSRRFLCRTDSHRPAAMIEKPNQHMMTSASNGEGSVSLPQAEQHKDISSKSDDARRLQVKDEEPLGERVIKHYVRRSLGRTDIHGPANMSVKPTQPSMASDCNGEGSIPLPQAEHHTGASAEVETEIKINVFRRRSKANPSQQRSPMNGDIDLQCKVTEDHTSEGYVRPDHQPRWLPEGWILEIRVRDEKKTPVRIRDKYYFNQKSGHRFRSRNEVLQFLDHERMGRDLMASDALGRKVQSQSMEGLVSNAPSLVASNPASTQLHTARMKTTPMKPASAVLSQANGTDLPQPREEDRNGSGLLRCSGAAFSGVRERGRSDSPAKNVVTSALDGVAANSPPPLSSNECARLLSGSSVPAAESPSDQGNNRGKLIFRLKRKQPDSDTGKGRSKRPMYEVVHGEKASSSTSTPSHQENNLTPGEKTGQVVTPALDSASTQVERTSAKNPPTSSLSHNFLSDSMLIKTQVENNVPVVDVSFSQPVAEQPAVMKPVVENATTNQTPQHLDLFLEPYTALGIPATARSSGLQHMASYSANHTHVFLDPLENTIPLSWHYYFTSQAPISITTSVPTLGPFPSLFNTSVSGSHSVANTVSIPIFEHFKGVSSSMQLNAASTLFPCPASGIDSRTRDSSSIVKMTEGVPQTQKATAPKALTKEQNSQLLLGLGRRLCLAGVEHKKKPCSSHLQTRATTLQDQSQQGFFQAISRMQ